MSNFITNSDAKNLKKRLIELIQKSDELKFLVGFFYFSGIRELYQGLKEKPTQIIKVLVGLNVDATNYGMLELAGQDEQASDEEKTWRFLQSVKKSLNTENFDTKEFYEQVKFFIQLIFEDKLIIRKTYKPNHAKLYLFKLEEGQVGRKNLFITGSSNLTRAGLTTQEEFNVEISDFGFDDADQYFDSLWEEAVRITEHKESKDKLIEIVKKETLIKEITPFEAFILVLKTYLDSFESREVGQSLIKTLEENGYTAYQYQLDAVKQSLGIIENNNGVIIADVVGLGKTIIACSVVKELKKRGIVICPPGLVGDRNKNSGWRRYAEEFKLYDWEVRSLGDLENITDFVNKTKDIEVVIVDEAHRFRNQDTKDYEYLKNICRNKIVILLTATPFNNRPGDILSLLKLFITPKKSSITLENNLVDKFKIFKGTFDRLAYIKKYWNSPTSAKRRKAEGYYQGFFQSKTFDLKNVAQRSHYLAKQIRDVIEPVTIRRNRLDLQHNPFYKDEVKNLSKVADPREWFFELTKEQSSFYDIVISRYFGDPDEHGQFRGALYRPFEYEIEREKIEGEKLTEKENFQFVQQRELYDFMRRLLVKRFESSFGAFEQSIKNFRKTTRHSLEFIEKTGEYILDRSLLEKIYDFDLDDIERYLAEYDEKILRGEYPKNHKRYKIKDFKYKEAFINHIKSDLKLFDEILARLSALDLIKNDPKVACLLKNIVAEAKQKPLKGEPKRKFVIFSEYLDTVKHLEPVLKKHFGERVLVVAGDLSAHKITQINRNFDASYPDQDNDFDILLATDKISEGFNLNRAGMVVNYDIPWNPVRVIQRVGRINRISKKVFNELYIVNFFPTERGSELVKSREIASNKMFLIHNTLGEDAKIFDIDEEPTPSGLFNRIQQNPDKQEEASFYTRALKEFLKIKKDNPEFVASLKNYPPRIKVAKKCISNELLVFLKKGRLYIHRLQFNDEKEFNIDTAAFEDVFDKIVCTRDEQALPLSGNFWDAYESVKKFKEHRGSLVSELSLEQKALNNLKTFIENVQAEQMMPHKDFLRTLREDVLDYGTLSDFTLRRITNLESVDEPRLKKAVTEIIALKKELGEDYLQKEKDRKRDLSKEIIIAIENQKHE
jgi:superfamily II DNA or RNA helicase/HKD family nuclease